MRLIVCFLLLISLLSGCASIVGGHSQSIAVETRSDKDQSPVSGVTCQLSNDKGVWDLTSPGLVTVLRSYENLGVRCEKEALEPGLASVKSGTKLLAFGNAILGGVVGAGVDIETGASYDYPSHVSITMGKFTSIDAMSGISSTPGLNQGPGVDQVVRPFDPGNDGRQVTGGELKSHFSNFGTVFASTPSGYTVRFFLDPRGIMDAKNMSTGGYASGKYRIGEANDQICFVVSYSNLDWSIVPDCVRLYDFGANRYALKMTGGDYFIKYSKN